MARAVAVVPHTHWDREWYSPYQTFRLRLVQVLDDLLAHLDADASYAHFMLDGQLAVVDDYLEVRPEAEAAIRRLVTAGRLSLGPWYTLPDEFLVSGETLVRDLQLGLERAARFGGAMAVGYLPDMFGHVAQMPQLLRSFGFEHAVVWRGVPSTVDRDAFWWSAPDGSTVRAEYLLEGYGNGAPVPDDAKALVGRVHDFETEHADRLTGPILWMDGTDHMAPQPWLGRVVAEANDLAADHRFEIVSLAAYLSTAALATASETLPTWQGELRSGARANLLMGVASNRVDVKQAAATCERTLERLAEPLCALFLPAAAWPASLLAIAWRDVVRNAAHDSICACSHDEVGLAVRHRYAEATRIGEGLVGWALAALGESVDAAPGTTVVVNPSARTRSGVVELIVPGEADAPPGTQTLRVRPASVELELDDASLAATVALQMEYERRYLGVRIEHAGTGEALVDAARSPDGQLVSPALRAELRALAEAPPAGPVRLVARQVPGRKVLARAVDVPGFGWQALALGDVGSGGTTSGPAGVVVAPEDGRSLSNGLITVAVDVADATFSIDGHRGLGLLVDGGDVGDTYNWCPPPDDVESRGPHDAVCTVTESGPVRGRLRVEATHVWQGVDVPVGTTLELRQGESFVRVTTELDNTVRDHRLRAWFALPEPADRSRAECAFATVERGLTAEGGPTEVGLPTFPSRRFVQAGGLTVGHEGLLEYELVDVRPAANGHRAHALALTVLRATGVISQGPMATRPLPAGPVVAAEDAQLQGPVVVRYVVALGPDVDPYAVVDDAFVPLQLTVATGAARTAVDPRGSAGTALAVRGAEVSAVRRTDGGVLEVRVFNPTASEVTVVLDGRRGWLVDLGGRPVEPFEGSFALRPWQIATAHLA